MSYDPTKCEREVSTGSGWSVYGNQCSRKWTERVQVRDGDSGTTVERRFCKQHAKSTSVWGCMSRPKPLHAIELTVTTTFRFRGSPESVTEESQKMQANMKRYFSTAKEVVADHKIGSDVLNAAEIEAARTGVAS